MSLTDRERPDIVLMDMSLPIMSGADATRAIRGNDAIKETPILALTASAMSTDRDLARWAVPAVPVDSRARDRADVAL